MIPAPVPPTARRARVLIVDDSALMRKIISDVLAKDPSIEVVGTAVNGAQGVQKVAELKPDLVTLDIEMPEMDGLTALKAIRRNHPTVKVIMCSTLTEQGARVTMEALASGAVDYVAKPGQSASVQESMQRLSEELGTKVRALARTIVTQSAPNAATGPTRCAVPSRPKTSAVRLVAIGSSTGGPNALADVFKTFRVPCPLPIVIVQHMPPLFTGMLAQRLNSLKCSVTFHEGVDGMLVEAGHGYIAPGGKHMEVRKDGNRLLLRLHEGPLENSCRPAVDVLFRSVADIYGGDVLAVVLTGMGNDGQRGCERLGPLGARVLVQDQATSVVWGMPGAVAQAGLADEALPISVIGGRMQELVQRYGIRPVRSMIAA